MTVSQLGDLAIGARSTTRWRSFASDGSGMLVVEGGGDHTACPETGEYHHRIVLHPNGNDDVLSVGPLGVTHTAFEAAKPALQPQGSLAKAH